MATLTREESKQSHKEAMQSIYGNCERLYLLYVNDFLTSEHFAEYLNVPLFVAENIIDIGKHYNKAQR